MNKFDHIIIGGGQAAASAVEGIRARDQHASILLLTAEPELPYERPPLSKQLWLSDKPMAEIYPHPESYYSEQMVTLKLGTAVTALDAKRHAVRDAQGNEYGYGKLLLATGGTPRKLNIPGGDLPGLCYFRTVADYRALRAASGQGKTAVIVGGGFIGAEMAAALVSQGVQVTMIFPEQWLGARVFPEALGGALTAAYRGKGVHVLSGDVPTAIEARGAGFTVRTRTGAVIEADMVIVGIGITPNLELARAAGLATADGVTVNAYLQTSDADIYAAGDVAHFPEAVLGPRRIEHWDCAAAHGKHAGGNMAATAGEARGGVAATAGAKFEQMPMFFSDLFEFGYEAVGEVDSRLQTVADWQEEFKTGVIYYLKDGKLRGALMCNVWGKVDEARALIRQGVGADRVKGAIAFA